MSTECLHCGRSARYCPHNSPTFTARYRPGDAASFERAAIKFTHALSGRQRKRVSLLRLPATINPDDRDKWRGFAASYAHLGRSVENFVADAVKHYRHGVGRHAEYTLTVSNREREIKALRDELGDVFP